MRKYMNIVERLLVDPREERVEFTVFTTPSERDAAIEAIRSKGAVAHETAPASKIGKIKLSIEGSHYLYDEVARALKMANLKATTMSEYVAPIKEAKSWDSLAGFNGDGEVCTCSDAQLSNVGCDCDAQQNLPVSCEECGNYLRSPSEIKAKTCKSCSERK